MIDNKLSQLFLGQAKILQKQLEKILDKDFRKMPVQNLPFEIQVLRSPPKFIIDNNEAARGKMFQIFHQSVPFFSSGLLVESYESDKKCIAAFDQGLFFPLKGPEIELDFKLPEINLIDIKKVQSEKIFSSLEKLNVVHNKDTDIFLLKPHPHFMILVCAKLGSPWLKVHMENYQRALLKACGDF